MSNGAATTVPELLARLEDVAVPAPVSWMPQTAAWAVLGVALAVGASVLTVWAIRRWRSNRYRREALGELAEIEGRLAAGDPSASASVAVLLRRVALHIAPRKDVASLSGESWLEFLDGRVKGTPFTTGAGRRLLEVPYAPPAQMASTRDDGPELLSRARQWIRQHRA
jgi:hypothetical protein